MSQQRLGMTIAGASQGLAFWLLVEHWPEGSRAAVAACVALATFLATSSLVWHFAWSGRALARLAALAAGSGVLYAAVAAWVGWQLPSEVTAAHGDQARQITWILATAVSLFALGPFLQVVQREGAPRFSYTALFLHSWNNLFVIVIALTFLAALWTVLWLWAALFELVKIDGFSDLFQKPLFVWAASGAALGLGVTLARESEHVVETLRRSVLTAHQVLLPLVSFVGVLFLVTLAVTGLAELWARDYASGLVLGWLTVHALFLNASFQDGREAPPRPRAIRVLLLAGVATLPIYAAIACYGLGLRIAQHGLTPLRFWGASLALIALSVSLGYAASVVRPGRRWLATFAHTNRALALAVILLALATHTPLLDPLRWSAESQLRRLLEGRVPAAEFDYGFLRFELGRAGERALRELEQLASHPEREAVREGVAGARAAESYAEWSGHRGPGLAASDFIVRSEDGVMPAGLVDAIRAQSSGSEWMHCRGSRACIAVPLDLDDLPGAEWIVRIGSEEWASAEVYARSGESWTRRGNLSAPGGRVGGEALRSGPIEAVAPTWRDVLVDGRRYRVVE